MSKTNNRKKIKTAIICITWFAVLSPILVVFTLLYIADDGTLPDITTLENPKTDLASVILSSDMQELGKYYRENRVNVHYNDLPEHLVNALIATEDERFLEHSGTDFYSLARALWGQLTFNPKGGGSTITMQLAKNLFTEAPSRGIIDRSFQKLQEAIITPKLERNYTKQEIIAMYLNKLDFVNNAVGINSAAQVYFNKKPIELNLEESAMLVGMAKNPSLFNPIRRPEKCIKRREVVLKQMLKNQFISSDTYDSVRKLPLNLDYKKADHQEGLAPYFRETLRAELGRLLKSKNNKGEYIISKPNGDAYDLYVDGLKIYTTIDARMQAHAEKAVKTHFSNYLQKLFNKNNLRWKNPPFSNDLSKEQIDNILNRALYQSMIYKKITGKACRICERPSKYIETSQDGYTCSYCNTFTAKKTKKEIEEVLSEKRKMKVFDWAYPKHEKDTLMSPIDSVKYYKGILRAGMMSMNPHNGHVKAWVGGPDFRHFKYDMVKKGTRQVGSTFKPFVYATALELGVINQCDQVPDIEYCIEVPFNKNRNKLWCPSNSGTAYTGAPTPISFALANSMNNITASIIKKGSMVNDVYNRIAQLGIDTSNPNLIPVPSMALGVFDLSVFNIVSASSAFANHGIYIEPVYLLRIEDKFGNIIFQSEQDARQVWNKETAYTMLEMMKLVTRGVKHPTLKNKSNRPLVGGTAIRIRSRESEKQPYAGISQPIAGKTGTTQNQSDGWFMGLTPDLVTGVWVGAEDRSVRFRTLSQGMGTNTALPIFAYYTKFINADDSLNISQGDFEMPETILTPPLDCSGYSSPSSTSEPAFNNEWEEAENEEW